MIKQLALLFKKKPVNYAIFFVLLLSIGFFLIPIPKPLFKSPYSFTLISKEGKLLSVQIAADEQWRFPPLDTIPKKFKIASKLFEDEYFEYHPGVNPISLVKAVYQNYMAKKIVRGGSTITMQTIRMALGNKSRTFSQKAIEILMALKLELMYDKESIFNLYANHAPFGGNIVGVNAASWRYFSRPLNRLSWAESAMLAVLPNNPKSIFPGKNNNELIQKRNNLLEKLNSKGYISDNDLTLYKAEQIPLKIHTLPNHAYHLLRRSVKEHPEQNYINSTLEYSLQRTVNDELNRYSAQLSEREIHNAAAIVLDIKSGEVLSYVGNSNNLGDHAQFVDIVNSLRSPGSLLKPILYASALDEGIIMPKQLLSDTPMHYYGFVPKNFDKKFRGVVPADNALTSSLNVPFVQLLRQYGYEKFHNKLRKIGFHSLSKPPDYYGLTLILGSAETTLWEISSVYASMARAYLEPFEEFQTMVMPSFRGNSYLKSPNKEFRNVNGSQFFTRNALDFTFKAMEQLERPDQESGWKNFNSSKPIAWKTGTSYGYKDAWAIGMNKNYLVGVWVGNADGESRPDLIGSKTAAPLMFNIFNNLKGDSIIYESAEDEYLICSESGLLASEICDNRILMRISDDLMRKSKLCSYHQLINLNKEKTNQVNSNCFQVSNIISTPWFILSPIESWYYKKINPSYSSPPSFLAECNVNSDQLDMELIYPNTDAEIHIPKVQDGSLGKVIFHAAHKSSSSRIFWHIDENYVGVTQRDHLIEIQIDPGSYKLTLIDDHGFEISSIFTITN